MELDLALSRSILEGSPDALLLHDEDCRFVWVNRRACELLGYSMDQLLGADLSIAEPDFDRFGFSEALAALAATDRLEVEGRPISADGRQLAVEVTVAPVVHSGGRRLFLAIVRDTTRRQRLEDTRRDTLERAERGRRSAERKYESVRGAASASMRAARGHAEVLATGAYGVLNEEQRRQLDAVIAGIVAVERLVSDDD